MRVIRMWLCCFVFAGITGVMSIFGVNAWGQGFPSRPVKVIIPYPAGGSADTLVRLLGQRLGEVWSQQVIADNRPGANGIIATDLAAKSPSDGYTLYLGTDATVSVNPSLYTNIPYDWNRDFAPISLLATSQQVLVVHPSLPARTVQDLIYLANEKPGQLNYASMGVGSSPHLGAELFLSLANVKITHVPYKGSAQSITALLGGEVSVFFVGESTAAPFVQAGKLRAIGTTGKSRSTIFPNIPTIAESGLPNYEMGIWFAMFAPGATPAPILRKLHDDIVVALEVRELRDALASRGFDATSSSPDELKVLVQKDTDRWSALIQRVGIKRQ